MDDCIFCKIIRNEIPNTTIYEDDDIKAFFDISQVTPGHTLVVPKKHIKNIFEYDEDLAQRVFKKVPMIARAIKESNPDIIGMNICLNNGEIAYQSVMHSHIHLVPRYSKDDGFSMKWADNTGLASNEQLQERADAIKKNLED
ncbi:diadenosine polyphosphate hydrolase [Companilactobacillus tucceti DSM 20183]|uniref:Diadenosine polyphosphate hydrolase n=1 Tax=Companilactobacillus tucceti DSM 20183 TaxID=1423811 RepID=A0A0R1JBW0_9LACO|nr:HIT family protein [Companilactobacillus tucceti]KRK65562.1 diadenosine polyphosphate hydrolase [Companilactobacillus tucceti DSM 20183]